MPLHQRVLLTVLAALAALTFAGMLAFFALIVLVGPHGGVLPSSLRGVVIALSWVFVLAVPALLARRVWRALASKAQG